MKASEVSELIEREINGDWSLSNAHGVDLRRCLVAPTVRVYEDCLRDGETLELWLVLEETPEDESGYKIVFNEKSGAFGLAMRDVHDRDIYLGPHGTFLATLAGM